MREFSPLPVTIHTITVLVNAAFLIRLVAPATGSIDAEFLVFWVAQNIASAMLVLVGETSE